MKQLMNELDQWANDNEKEEAYLPSFVKLSTHIANEGISIQDSLNDSLVYEGNDTKLAFETLMEKGLVWESFVSKECSIEKVFTIHDNVFLDERKASSISDGKDVIRECYTIIRKGDEFKEGGIDGSSFDVYLYSSYEAAKDELEEELAHEKESSKLTTENEMPHNFSQFTERELLEKALFDFRQAHRDLVEHWSELDELDSAYHYPFEGSFDEYNVEGWVGASLEELHDKKQEQEKQKTRKSNDRER